MYSWNDVEEAVKNNKLDSLDTATLEELSKVAPPLFNNPGLIAQAQYKQSMILRSLEQRSHLEKEKRVEALKIHNEKWYKKPIGIVWLAAIGAVLAVIIIYLIKTYLSIPL